MPLHYPVLLLRKKSALPAWLSMKTTVVLLAISLLLAASSQAAEPARSKIKRFVQQVVLGPEFGSNRKVASRWMTAPTLSVFGATPEQKAVVQEVVTTINPSLKAQIGEIQLLPDNAKEATMKVYFAPLQDFPKIARDNGAEVKKGNIGYFWMFWDEKNAMTSTGVLLASDKLRGAELKHFAFEEITQSLGLAEDADEFPESIFYSRGSNGGAAARPSALDLQLLQWFYQHVLPGDDRKAISAKFEATWPK